MSEEKRPIITVSNLYCAFCGKHEFYYENYAFECVNCESRIHYQTNGTEWIYSYPPAHLSMPKEIPSGTTWKGNGRYFSPIPKYYVKTGKKIPDYDLVRALESEKAGLEKSVAAVQTKIERVLHS